MKTVIVTGASSGIGREFAEVLGNLSHVEEIWVIARRGGRLEELKNTIAATVLPLELDLTRNEALDAYRKLLADRNPQVVALVNAAGYGCMGEVENVELSDQRGMIDLNITALTAITKLTLPYMSYGAEIYQLGSFSAFTPLPYMSVYAATKAYVLSFSRSLNVELKARGIHSMAVCPSWVRTEFPDRAATYRDVIVFFDHFYTPEQVIQRALRDMKKRKDVSVCGGKHRLLRLSLKLLPQRFAMKLWCIQQKK